MIEKLNIASAAGNVTMGVGAAFVNNFVNGCTVTHPSAGVYTITLDQALAASAIVPLIQGLVAAATACVFSAVLTSPTVITVTTSATLGGAAADIAGSFAFAVLGIGAPGTSGV